MSGVGIKIKIKSCFSVLMLFKVEYRAKVANYDKKTGRKIAENDSIKNNIYKTSTDTRPY